MRDEIYLTKRPDPMEGPPVIPASVPGFIKHVHCDGARFHVPRYSGRLNVLGKLEPDIRCSEPNCILNYRETTDAK